MAGGEEEKLKKKVILQIFIKMIAFARIILVASDGNPAETHLSKQKQLFVQVT